MNRDVIIQCLKICAEPNACEGCFYKGKPMCDKLLLQDAAKILEADAKIEKELYEEKSFRLFLMHNVPHISWTFCKDKMPKEGGHYRVAAWWRGEIVIDEDDLYSYGWDDYGDSVFAWSEIPESEYITGIVIQDQKGGAQNV